MTLRSTAAWASTLQKDGLRKFIRAKTVLRLDLLIATPKRG